MKPIKQLLLTTAVLLCSATVNAYDFEVDGIYYNIVSITDLTVEVTDGDNDYYGKIVIPEDVTYKSKTLSVTRIGGGAFGSCSSLTSLTIPNSVTSIGVSAFRYCSSLTSLTIPNSVTSIGGSAFWGCSSLKELRLEDGTETLSLGKINFLFSDCSLETLYLGRNLSYETNYNCKSPFEDNETLTSVTIGNSVTSIGGSAFYGCRSLKELRLEDGTKTLSLVLNDLFYNCSLETLYLGRNLSYKSDYNGSSPFEDNETLTSVTIGDSVTSIGNYAFCGCSSLTSLTIPNSVTSIGGCAFEFCRSLTSLTIPNSVTSIGDYAFYDCSSLTSVTIGNSVASIGKYAFWDCSSLTSLTIPNSVTSIGDHAFYDCSSLTSVTIGNSVTSIGVGAFDRCNALSELLIAATVPPTVGIGNFSNSNYINTVVKVPEGSLAAYQAANVWKNFWSIEEFVTGIEDVQMDTRNTTSSIYTLQGVQIKEAKENLPDGIYIQNGKKFIVK